MFSHLGSAWRRAMRNYDERPCFLVMSTHPEPSKPEKSESVHSGRQGSEWVSTASERFNWPTPVSAEMVAHWKSDWLGKSLNEGNFNLASSLNSLKRRDCSHDVSVYSIFCIKGLCAVCIVGYCIFKAIFYCICSQYLVGDVAVRVVVVGYLFYRRVKETSWNENYQWSWFLEWRSVTATGRFPLTFCCYRKSF